MPLFMDRHDIPGVSAEDVAEAHQKDLLVQHKFDCRALTYWFDERKGVAFCLIEAPDKEAVQNLHNHAHGLIPNQIIEVEPNLVASFLGRIEDPVKRALSPSGTIIEPAFRCIMVVYINAGSYFDVAKSLSYIKSKIRNQIKRHKGLEVVKDKEVLLVSFESIEQSICCAIAVQQEINSISRRLKKSNDPLQIGLAAGVPVSGNEPFFGPTVKLAERLGLIAKPGHILSSNLVGERFADSFTDYDGKSKPKFSSLNPKQENLINQMMEILEDAGCDSEFNVREFAKKTGMSKSMLYRNIITITGFSPIGFIKEYRLKMALNFINKKYGNVSEIAYESGFSSLSYFSKCFQDRFGISPSTYANNVA